MINPSPLYRLSLALTVLLTLAAFITLLAGVGTLIRGWGQQPFLALLPWQPLVLVLLAGLNCSLRVRLILHRR